MYYKVPQNENVGGLNDNGLHFLIIWWSYSSMQSVYKFCYVLRPQSQKCLLVMNV